MNIIIGYVLCESRCDPIVKKTIVDAAQIRDFLALAHMAENIGRVCVLLPSWKKMLVHRSGFGVDEPQH